ncbi:MAG: DUF4358 domain-containing protein [Acetatifactor sp.]|nr:DUF4358 domain-containing protein [Acetatifactor sp.]
MKKLIALLSVSVLALGIMGCGADQSGVGGSDVEESGVEESGVDESGGEEYRTVEMSAIKDAIVEELGDDYWPNMPLDSDMLEGFIGVTSDMYEDFLAEIPMISTNVDTLIVVRAKEDQVDAVEKAMNDYRDAKVSDTMQYPQNLGKIQASKVARLGNYVIFVQLGADVMDVLDQGDEAVILHCQKVNDKVIDIIRTTIQ